MNCQTACPKLAIAFETDCMDNIYPKIDAALCVGCGKCMEVCPVLHPVSTHAPIACHAVYSKDETVRRHSASGGFAATLYRHCLENGIAFSGVYFDKTDWVARHKTGHSLEDIDDFANSKYTFSFMGSIAEEIRRILKGGQKACFVGLPCQVAAVRQYLVATKTDDTMFYAVDLCCHGIASHKYLIDHLRKSVCVDAVDGLTFRDPAYHASKYVFTVLSGKKVYRKCVESNDNYQIGYHNSTIYRPNCYACKYANPGRVSDLTIGDFRGLGKIAPYDGNCKKDKLLGITCVLVNTVRGEELLATLFGKGAMHGSERPLEEALSFITQLKRPPVPPKYRKRFLALYPSKGFSGTLDSVFKFEKMKRPLVKACKDVVKFFLGRA